MWLVSTQGFYSVVEHRDDPDKLIVRCRVKSDMYALREQIPDLKPWHDRTADYGWRAIVKRSDWLGAMLDLGADIDYDNFKNRVKAQQGPTRARVYMNVWLALLELSPKRRRWPRLLPRQ